MKKIIIKIVLIMTALILLIPIPISYEDGGTVSYQAVLYSITNYHELIGINEYNTGIEIKILDITVYKNKTFKQ